MRRTHAFKYKMIDANACLLNLCSKYKSYILR